MHRLKYSSDKQTGTNGSRVKPFDKTKKAQKPFKLQTLSAFVTSANGQRQTLYKQTHICALDRNIQTRSKFNENQKHPQSAHASNAHSTLLIDFELAPFSENPIR